MLTVPKGLFKIIETLNPTCQDWLLTNVSLEVRAMGLIWQSLPSGYFLGEAQICQ